MIKIFLTLFFSLCLYTTSFAKWGEGNLKLSKEVMESVIMYMYGAGNPKYSGADNKKQDPMLMAVSEDGNAFYYLYCPAEYNGNCIETGVARTAIVACEKYSNGSPCFVFAKKRKIVWNNGSSRLSIKKKDLKSPFIVAQKIQEAGFYDEDISKLIGINLETGQIDENILITGEKKNSNSETQTISSNIVEELETLTKLYENGSLTKEEFKKAKDKLFNN